MEAATTEFQQYVAKVAPESGVSLENHIGVHIVSLMVRWPEHSISQDPHYSDPSGLGMAQRGSEAGLHLKLGRLREIRIWYDFGTAEYHLANRVNQGMIVFIQSLRLDHR